MSDPIVITGRHGADWQTESGTEVSSLLEHMREAIDGLCVSIEANERAVLLLASVDVIARLFTGENAQRECAEARSKGAANMLVWADVAVMCVVLMQHGKSATAARVMERFAKRSGRVIVIIAPSTTAVMRLHRMLAEDVDVPPEMVGQGGDA